MASWRDTKRSARRVVHDTMRVPAVVIHGAEQHSVWVRIHYAPKEIGGVKGTSFGYSEFHEKESSAVFWAFELEPKNGMVISISSTEAYTVDTVEPRDDVTVTANTVRIPAKKIIGLPVPGDIEDFPAWIGTTGYGQVTSAPTGGSVGNTGHDLQFLPTPDALEEDALYFYLGWSDVDAGWLVRKKLRAGVAYTDYRQSQNPAVSTLEEAMAAAIADSLIP